MDSAQLHRSLIGELSSMSEVAAIITIGKAAKLEKFDITKLRDIDLMVVLSGERGFERQVEPIGGLPYDISFISLMDLKEQLLKRKPVWISALAKGKVEYINASNQADIDEIIESAKNSFKEGIELPGEERVKYIRFSVFSLLEELESKIESHVEFRFCSTVALDKIIDYYFELRGIWSPKTKKKLETLKSYDIELYALIEDFYKALIAVEAYECMGKIAKHIMRPFGGVLETFEKGIYPLED